MNKPSNDLNMDWWWIQGMDLDGFQSLFFDATSLSQQETDIDVNLVSDNSIGFETEPFSIRIWPSNKAVHSWKHSKNKVPKNTTPGCLNKWIISIMTYEIVKQPVFETTQPCFGGNHRVSSVPILSLYHQLPMVVPWFLGVYIINYLW